MVTNYLRREFREAKNSMFQVIPGPAGAGSAYRSEITGTSHGQDQELPGCLPVKIQCLAYSFYGNESFTAVGDRRCCADQRSSQLGTEEAR